MREEEFDRLLAREVGELPPAGESVNRYTPWEKAMGDVLWGMALQTFQIGAFYLQYLLPLLGAALCYLGYRSLRGENRWFRYCWYISGGQLACHILWDILLATPFAVELVEAGWGMPLGLALNGVALVQLMLLRRAIGLAFAATGEERPKDWLKWGIFAHVLVLLVAIWCDLVPLTELGFFGEGIMEKWRWLYFGRSFVSLGLEGFFFYTLAKQRSALAGRGYAITPAPVRWSGRAVLALVLAVTLLTILPVLERSYHLSPERGEPAAALTAEEMAIRDRLVELGLPRDLADSLAPGELERCREAVEVQAPGSAMRLCSDDDYAQEIQDTVIEKEVDGGRVEVSSWLVVLPGNTMRSYFWFSWQEMPRHRYRELVQLDPSGNYPTGDCGGRLLWETEAGSYAAELALQYSGGQTAEELGEFARQWNREELKRLGRMHETPWAVFALPKEGQRARGYLAFSRDVSGCEWREEGFYDFERPSLDHQCLPLCYPFRPMEEMGFREKVLGRFLTFRINTSVDYFFSPLNW